MVIIGRFMFQPEPFMISLALYDAKEGKKISEDFHCDLNSPEIRAMIPLELIHATDMLNSVDGHDSSQPKLEGVSEKWLQDPRLVSNLLSWGAGGSQSLGLPIIFFHVVLFFSSFLFHL